jgi:hypothetical protein
MITYLKEAQSLDVPTGGKPTDGIISFVVSDLINAVEAYAKEQVIKELIWLMGETPVNTDEIPDALNVSVIEERCKKIEQELNTLEEEK